jgi:hypothetical protein
MGAVSGSWLPRPSPRGAGPCALTSMVKSPVPCPWCLGHHARFPLSLVPRPSSLVPGPSSLVPRPCLAWAADTWSVIVVPGTRGRRTWLGARRPGIVVSDARCWPDAAGGVRGDGRWALGSSLAIQGLLAMREARRRRGAGRWGPCPPSKPAGRGVLDFDSHGHVSGALSLVPGAPCSLPGRALLVPRPSSLVSRSSSLVPRPWPCPGLRGVALCSAFCH